MLAKDEISSIKQHVQSELEAANIKTFSFGFNPDLERYITFPSAPFAISTSLSKDHDTMDASLLMSSEYIQPLVESELAYLVSRLFDQDIIAWLRHSTAKKFVQWRASSTPISKPQYLYQRLTYSPSSSQALTAPVGATTSYALARISDHTQREERIAQVRLANWAADLQRSLQNERARFDALARSERAVWLTERLGECVQDGTIIPLSQARAQNPQFGASLGALVKKGTYSRQRKHEKEARSSYDVHDPLGLLQLNADLRRKGWKALKLVSSFGILGGIAFWVARSFQISGIEAWWTLDLNGLGIRDWIELRVVDWGQ